MANIIIAPGKYIQGKNELQKLPQRLKDYGSSFVFLVDDFIHKTYGGQLKENLQKAGIEYHVQIFGKECSKAEIEKIRKHASGMDAIVGIGGGKTLDTAKAVAYYEKLPVVIMPTIASTDAPCSALSVLYTEDGVFEEYLFLPKNPECVILDTQLIVNAPVRLLVAGMGDALATYFEARACQRSNALTIAGGHATMSAMALAELCYNTLIADGYKAKLAAQTHSLTKAVENIIEANTLLSGIGFESSGLSGAHAIHNGMTALPETHELYHGEKVAFGTITQLVLENAPLEELYEVIDFCKSVGLPTTFADLGVPNVTRDQLMEVAKLVCAPTDTMGNMPFEVEPDEVVAAMVAANEIGMNH